MRKFFSSLSFALVVVLFLSSWAAGFGTFWHAQATEIVGREFGFAQDASDIIKLGNFHRPVVLWKTAVLTKKFHLNWNLSG